MTRRRVLFVDDEERILSGLRGVLRKKPFELLTTTSPQEALRLLAAEGADVIVSDEHMAGMRGTELLARVAREHPEVVRIMLTGSAHADTVLKAINEGEVYRFLVKPCSALEVAVVIEQALEVKTLRDESMKLLALAKRQQALLTTLELRHPGITRLASPEAGDDLVVEEETASLEALLRDAEASLTTG